jgi:hypothetical protein
MSEWWTYRLSDFLMFSAQTYERLLARQHVERWPLPLVVMLALLALLALAGRTRRGAPLLLGALALGWAAVAADFLALRYARIYLGAPVMAWLFALQALLLAALGIAAWRHDAPPLPWSPRAAAALVLLAWPLVAPFSGRPVTSAEWVGFTPDPTALFTLCLLPALCGRRWSLGVSLLPLATCAAGSATLHLLQLPLAWLPLAAAVVACAAGWAAARR